MERQPRLRFLGVDACKFREHAPPYDTRPRLTEMTELILHHYDISPYAEKIRLALGLKGLVWASVIVPATLPKPDLMPLTGGFRRTPVLQIGADYHLNVELIERVRTGDWDPDNRDSDRQSRDALAARGYWQTFQLVRETVRAVIAGDDPGVHARAAHQDWYRELFQPSVAAGLVPASALAGYRNGPVFLRGSRHVPPRWETVRDAMPAYFDLLESEAEPSVKAVLGHWLFGYIHPYADGNGRMARFVMNALLASGGYPWTVIHVDDRDAYLATLERASIDQDMKPFARFVAQRVESALDRADAKS